MKVRGPEGKLQVAVALLISIGLIGYGGYTYVNQSDALSNSVKVNATVDSTGVREVDGGRRSGVEYKPQVSFSYMYDGDDYSSENVYPEGLAPSYNTEDAAKLSISEGDDVTAYVEKDSPENAFLKHEASNKPLYFVGFGILVIMVTAYKNFIS